MLSKLMVIQDCSWANISGLRGVREPLVIIKYDVCFFRLPASLILSLGSTFKLQYWSAGRNRSMFHHQCPIFQTASSCCNQGLVRVHMTTLAKDNESPLQLTAWLESTHTICT